MSPEIDVLDQLLGGDMPLGVVASLFPDEADARRAIVAMLAVGELAIFDAEGAALSPWQVGELQRQPGSWREDTQYRLTITDKGARRVG
jgi:hypothetical protein